MSVRMRHTSSHTKNRRSHHALVGTNVVTDKESGTLRLPHRIDEATGMYRGKQIAAKKVVVKKDKKAGRGEKSVVEHDHLPAVDEKKAVKPTENTMARAPRTRTNARSGMGGGS